MMKTVRWLFDYDNGDEEEEEKSNNQSNDEDSPKSILKESSEVEKKSKEKKKEKNDEEEEEEEIIKPKVKNSIRREKEDNKKSWRASWNRRQTEREKNRKLYAEKNKNKKGGGIRNSLRNSLGRSKPKPTESKLSVELDKAEWNKGAIDENGEYKQAKLEDSNIAGIGSEEDRALRMKAAKSEREFKGVGKKAGLKVWRVENRRTKNDCPDFGIKKWPKDEYGNFFSGDSYLILNAYHPVDPLTKKKNKNKLEYDIHFWLGKDSSQDEIGVAAYKAVELDNLLGDLPVQHREVQYHESKLFLSYFKELRYMEGGIESGFRKVKPTEYEPRLLMVRHTNRVCKAFEIPCKANCINEGDCFILDAGTVVYRYIGESSNFFEKNKSGLLQHNIVSARHGKAIKADPDDAFWEILKGTEKDVRPEDQPYELDIHDEKLDPSHVKLWRISDATGKLEFTLEDEGQVNMSKLDSDDCFLVHANIGIWVWLGSGATKTEKKQTMSFADKYIKSQKLPNTMTVTAIPEAQASKNALFLGLFQGGKSSRR